MAIIKVVSSKASITNAIDYVTKKEKTNDKLVSGYNLNAKYAKEQMAITKNYGIKLEGEHINILSSLIIKTKNRLRKGSRISISICGES